MNGSSDIKAKKKSNFKIIEVENWTMKEEFLNQPVENEKQEKFLKFIKDIIKDGKNKNFICPIIDPSSDEKGNIIYQKGKEPFTSKSAIWWENEMKKFSEKYQSKMGNIYNYALLQAYRLKIKDIKLKEITDDSRRLGNYFDNLKSRRRLEQTGTFKIGEFYDLANLAKIVEDPDKIFSSTGFVLVGGSFFCGGREYPIMNIEEILTTNVGYFIGIGWMNLKK